MTCNPILEIGIGIRDFCRKRKLRKQMDTQIQEEKKLKQLELIREVTNAMKSSALSKKRAQMTSQLQIVKEEMVDEESLSSVSNRSPKKSLKSESLNSEVGLSSSSGESFSYQSSSSQRQNPSESSSSQSNNSLRSSLRVRQSAEMSGSSSSPSSDFSSSQVVSSGSSHLSGGQDSSQSQEQIQQQSSFSSGNYSSSQQVSSSNYSEAGGSQSHQSSYNQKDDHNDSLKIKSRNSTTSLVNSSGGGGIKETASNEVFFAHSSAVEEEKSFQNQYPHASTLNLSQVGPLKLSAASYNNRRSPYQRTYDVTPSGNSFRQVEIAPTRVAPQTHQTIGKDQKVCLFPPKSLCEPVHASLDQEFWSMRLNSLNPREFKKQCQYLEQIDRELTDLENMRQH